MANDQRTLTAPLAIVKVKGKAVAKLKDINVTEQIRRGRVSGIGLLTPEELPALEWSGNLTASSYLTSAKIPLFDGSFLRKVNNAIDFVNFLLLQESGVQIDLLRKVSLGQDAQTGIHATDYEIFASVVGCFGNRDSFNISEGQLSGRNVDFEYTNPIIFID